MYNCDKIVRIHTNSFTANVYTTNYFRRIGLIDIDVRFSYGIERMTVAFYSSSGTNSHKIKGMWYPIVGIKTMTGPFIEFPSPINNILTQTTRNGGAHSGWLAKSLFFYNPYNIYTDYDGFSYGKFYSSLLQIGTTLQKLCNQGRYINAPELDSASLNATLFSLIKYSGNNHSQLVNYTNFISEIYNSINPY